MTKDPTGFAGGDANLYAYAGNDPVNYSDPLGNGRWDRFKRWVRVFVQVAGIGLGQAQEEPTGIGVREPPRDERPIRNKDDSSAPGPDPDGQDAECSAGGGRDGPLQRENPAYQRWLQRPRTTEGPSTYNPNPLPITAQQIGVSVAGGVAVGVVGVVTGGVVPGIVVILVPSLAGS